jgi:hypothetical protein
MTDALIETQMLARLNAYGAVRRGVFHVPVRWRPRGRPIRGPAPTPQTGEAPATDVEFAPTPGTYSSAAS